jgi:hypothetical protein
VVVARMSIPCRRYPVLLPCWRVARPACHYRHPLKFLGSVSHLSPTSKAGVQIWAARSELRR